MTLVAGDDGLAAILWDDDRGGRVRLGSPVERGRHPVLDRTEVELAEFFAGDRKTFGVPLDLIGTPFQRAVWAALLAIPYGATRTYREVATSIGRPQASRAVGAAVGRNPVSIIVPCHRVVGSDGSLTGFAGGVESKRYLLDHERH